MLKILNVLKVLIRPLFHSLKGIPKNKSTIQEIWSGGHTSWSEAQKKCSGYENVAILEKCKNALLKVKNGEAVYERDSVLFDKIQYSWGLPVGLQRAAIENSSNLCVLDFGGSLGSSYYQNREFLSTVKDFQWCIVEQPHFVNCGKELFEDDQLRFYGAIEDCMAKHKPNVIVLSGVLQYLEKPADWIEKVLQLKIKYIIIDRTAFVKEGKDILTIQNVPESIYQASYPAWFFNYQNFLQNFALSYELILEFEDAFTGNIQIMNKYCFWKGLIFRII